MHVFQTSCFNGLNTDTFKVVTAGQYTMSAHSTMQPGSGLTVTLAQTGSVSASIATIASEVGSRADISKTFNCAAGDVLTCAVTSSTAVDQPPAFLKTQVYLSRIS